MPASRVTAFDKTLELTHHWLEEITSELGWEDQEKGYTALRAVLHALRDRVPPNEAVQLAAQLPMLVRGFYFDGWHPANKPLKYRHKKEFLQQVKKEAPGIAEDEVELTVTAVFHRLSVKMPGGEIDQVRAALPAEVRELWAHSGL